MILKLKPYLVPALISIFSYLYFFYPLINSDTLIYSGADSVRLHYASRMYLADNLSNNQFPFWTDRMFTGYPIFSDLERGYQNIPNLILVYFFGAFNSYKILHFSIYFIGSISLYLLLKSHLSNPIFFLPINLIYFFSFLMLIHQQHFNTILTFYLLPLIVYLSDLHSKHSSYKIPILLSFIYFFIITLGSLQAVLIVFVVQTIYYLSFCDIKYIKKLFVPFLVFSFLLSAPSLYSFYQLYTQSNRALVDISGNGNIDIYLLIQFFYPFAFGVSNFNGGQVNDLYVKNEHSVYFGIVIFLTALFSFLSVRDTKIKVFSGLCLFFFLISNTLLIPPFSIFRYWIRAEIALTFLFIILTANLFDNQSFAVSKKKFAYGLSILLIAALPLLFNKNFFFIFKNSLNEDLMIPMVWCILLITTLIILFSNIRSKVYLITFLITFDILFFSSKLDSNLFINISQIKYEPINSKALILKEVKNDDYALLNNSISTSGYSVLSPTGGNYQEALKNSLSFKNLYPIYAGFYLLYIVAVYTFIKYQNRIYEFAEKNKHI